MKMLAEDYQAMKDKIDALVRSRGNVPEIHADYLARGINEKCFRWDLYWASGAYDARLYSYLNDEQIDTALRKIVRELNI